jgi:hypothetical protein
MVSALALPCFFGSAQAAETIAVHLPHRLSVGKDVRVGFRAAALPEHGYYYAVIVLKPYRHYTRSSPPPCSTSSNMQRTDYGDPGPKGLVVLTLAPGKSSTRRWCPGGTYMGGVYAVPHPPPCESAYGCGAEPYERPGCAGVGPGCVHGVIARPKEYAYPDGLPSPRTKGTRIVGRFTVRFPR